MKGGVWWFAIVLCLSTPAFGSKIQVQPDPGNIDFALTATSQGVVLRPDGDSKTEFDVSLASFDAESPADPPREPVEGWFDLKALTEGEPDSFDISVGLPYDRLRSDETLPLAVIAVKVEGSDGDANKFLRSVHSADLTNLSVLIRHFWMAEQIWVARKAVLDLNQHSVDLFDVSIAYWYVVLAREAQQQLTIAPPASSLEAAAWLTNLAAAGSQKLFNPSTTSTVNAIEAAKNLKYGARIQDVRIGRILNAVDSDFQNAGGLYDSTICSRVRETLRMIGDLSREQWGSEMAGLRTRALIYSSGCLTTEVAALGKGDEEKLKSIKEKAERLVQVMLKLPKSRQVTSSIQTLKNALGSAIKRV
jgi:hypothetical protein